MHIHLASQMIIPSLRDRATRFGMETSSESCIMYMHVCVYIYIYRERESVCVCVRVLFIFPRSSFSTYIHLETIELKPLQVQTEPCKVANAMDFQGKKLLENEAELITQ